MTPKTYIEPLPEAVVNNRQIDEFLADYRESYFYAMGVDGLSVNSKAPQLGLNKKLPVHFIKLHEKIDRFFEESFEVEAYLHTDVKGNVLCQRGQWVLRMDFLFASEGNRIYSVFQNTVTGEKSQLESVIPAKGFYDMDSLDSNWVRVMVNSNPGSEKYCSC